MPLLVMFVPAVTDSVPAALTVPRSIEFVSTSVMFVPEAFTAPVKSLPAVVSVMSPRVEVRFVAPETSTVPLW